MTSSSIRTVYDANIRTVYDAGQERRDEFEQSVQRARMAQMKLATERRTLALYPEIGILQRGRQTFFYLNPIGGIYVESADIDVLARNLGPMRIVPHQNAGNQSQKYGFLR